jgi:hypothetical protein
MLMKNYATDAVLSVIAGGVDEATFRKWSWEFVEAVSYLESTVVNRIDNRTLLVGFISHPPSHDSCLLLVIIDTMGEPLPWGHAAK